MNYKELAIADCLKHPVIGMVSNQPDLREPLSDVIRVRDSKGRVHYILASVCSEPTAEEKQKYWHDFPKVNLGVEGF